MQAQNQYLDYLIDPSFKEVIKLFIWLFEDIVISTGHRIFSSKRGNKRLQCYDQWKKLCWSASKKWYKGIWYPWPLGITATTSVTDAAIQKKIFGWGMTTLTISNEEMKDIM